MYGFSAYFSSSSILLFCILSQVIKFSVNILKVKIDISYLSVLPGGQKKSFYSSSSGFIIVCAPYLSATCWVGHCKAPWSMADVVEGVLDQT